MGVFADLDLARRLERLEAETAARFVEARARINPGLGACWMEVAGTYAMFDGPASPVTQTFGLGLWSPVTPAVLDALEEFFTSRGAPVFHEVSPLAGVEVFASLADRGYRPVELTSVLYRPAAEPLNRAINPRIGVRRAAPEEHELWSQIAARGWASEHPELMDFLLDFGKVIAEKGDGTYFLAELDGSPVAAGVLSLGNQVALLAGASTVPEARRNGAQLALLDARLQYAAGQGCDLAMMCAAAGSTSQRNAERHGFRIAYTRVKWALHRESNT
jgi:GNAT superfamily N-acetyltransferase